jgi:hypothetical protein
MSGVITSVARMTTSTALIVIASNRPSFAPTSVVASVAAACEPDRPDITPTSGQVKWKARPATTAASALPPRTVTVNTSATSSVFGSTNTFGSSSTPTETRKIGMNSVEPMNWRRSMSGLSSGTARLSPRPAKNAPTMPSIPAASASTPPTRNAPMPNTKRYARSVPTRAKNQRATRGRPSSDQVARMARPTAIPTSCTPRLPVGLTTPDTTDRTSSAEVSVTAVAPTTVATARLRDNPISRSIG